MAQKPETAHVHMISHRFARSPLVSEPLVFAFWHGSAVTQGVAKKEYPRPSTKGAAAVPTQ
eukprot:2621984-Amphidinium_carterae.1